MDLFESGTIQIIDILNFLEYKSFFVSATSKKAYYKKVRSGVDVDP